MQSWTLEFGSLNIFVLFFSSREGLGLFTWFAGNFNQPKAELCLPPTRGTNYAPHDFCRIYNCQIINWILITLSSRCQV